MKRRSFIFGSTALLATLQAPAVWSAGRDYNTYAAAQAASVSEQIHIARTGDTWENLFGNRAEIVKFYNRQNLQIEAGQLILIPPQRANLESIAPFLSTIDTNARRQVIVSPIVYAWALYIQGQLVRWGPAVCGGDWCQDVGRSCRSPQGSFTVSEAAGPDRRSNAYPREAAAEGRGALMPYFMRITDYGVGLHARYMRGRHETHGCIGMFYQDARWLNEEHARQHQLRVVMLAYTS